MDEDRYGTFRFSSLTRNSFITLLSPVSDSFILNVFSPSLGVSDARLQPRHLAGSGPLLLFLRSRPVFGIEIY